MISNEATKLPYTNKEVVLAEFGGSLEKELETSNHKPDRCANSKKVCPQQAN